MAADQAPSVAAPAEDELVEAELQRARSGRRRGRARIIGIIVSIAVIGVVFAVVLPKIAGYREVWDVVKTLTWEWIVALLAVTLINLLSNAPPWMAALPGLGFVNALRVTMAASALSLVAPGGTAVGMATQFGMLKSWGLEGRPVGLAVALTNIWSQLVKYGFPVIALAGLAAEGGSNRSLELVALIGLIIFVVIVAGFAAGLSSKRSARAVGDRAARAASWSKRLIRKRPVSWSGAEFVRFRSETIELLRRRWHVLTVATLASQLAVFVVLVVSLRAVGVTRVQVSIVEAFAAWSLTRALGSIPITPGGFGIEELVLTGTLVGFGADNAAAVAATLIYRFLTVVPILVLGLLAAGTYKVGKPRVPNGDEAIGAPG